MRLLLCGWGLAPEPARRRSSCCGRRRIVQPEPALPYPLLPAIGICLRPVSFDRHSTREESVAESPQSPGERFRSQSAERGTETSVTDHIGPPTTLWGSPSYQRFVEALVLRLTLSCTRRRPSPHSSAAAGWTWLRAQRGCFDFSRACVPICDAMSPRKS